MSELPKGWVETTIGALIFNMIGGASPKKENYSISGTLALNKGDIKENGIIKIKDQANYLPQEFVDKHVSKKVTTGTILVTLRDLSQKADFLGLISTYRGNNEALITQGMYALSTSEFIIDDLLVLYSNTIFYRLYVKQKKIGATQVHLRNEQFLNIPFPLAPLAEQKRIVEKLDQVLAQVNTIKARLDGIPAILKRFRQSVLAAAVSGKLTEGWRGSQKKFNSWESHKIGNLVSKIEAGKNIRCIERPPENDEVGIVKISAVTWGVFNEIESKTLSDRDLFMENRRIQKGDFLISRANTIELLGNPVIVSSIEKNLMLSDKVLRLVMDSDDKPWLNIFLRSIYGRKEIESRSTGNQMSMRNIGQKALLDIDIPKPIKEEQTEIVRLVDQYFAFADTIEKQVQKAQQRVDKLTQSILAKAFRGELVPQDPSDEPADELLKRIAVARAEAGVLALSAKKTAKKVGKTTKV